MSVMYEFPYIQRVGLRTELEEKIMSVAAEGGNQAILLYGEGGVGKTYFVRHLSQESHLEGIVWLGPYDVDDAEYWMLSRLAENVSKQLDPNGQYFGRFQGYLAEVPQFELPRIGHETVLAKLKEGDEIFFDCYSRFVEGTGKTPVLILDTVEAIRGLDVLTDLVAWMKHLSQSVFILAARPSLERSDPIREEIAIEHIPCVSLNLVKFTDEESERYLKACLIEGGLDDEEIKKLIFLCDGSPLFLTLAVDYLLRQGLPDWMISDSDGKKQQELPNWFRQKLSEMRQKEAAVRDEFLRLLVVPYRSSEFWHEAVKRLGVVRRRLGKEAWLALMSDRPLPEGVRDWDEAWDRFRVLPWIRQRASGNEITLHDGLAEQLAKRVLPIDDKDGSWRTEQWRKVMKIYDALLKTKKQKVEEERNVFKQMLKSTVPGSKSNLLQRAMDLDVRNVEVFLLSATEFYYSLLSDFELGVQRFCNLFDEAARAHEYRFINLLWLELQHFLPGYQTFDPLEDIVRPQAEQFRRWYRDHPEYQFEMGRRVAKYLTDVERVQPAVSLLSDLLKVCKGKPEWEYELLNLRANAYMRLSGGAQRAGRDFKSALALTRQKTVAETIRDQEWHALMELGFYYRNTGRWREAAESYRQALETISFDKPLERARVESQYAYVQALRGRYDDAIKLIESALAIRRKLGSPQDIGMALSVQGEVHRYMRRFTRAWASYKEAEAIFTEYDIPAWLGLVRQEMAICLFQSFKEPLSRLGEYDDERKMLEGAKELALDAVEICRRHSKRALPAALNRAGRIVAETDFDNGLVLLKEGVDAARAVTDQWFYFANLIEYAEHCHQAWMTTGDIKYRQFIDEYAKDIEKASKQQKFPDLQGRWEVLKGHLAAASGLASKSIAESERTFDEALKHYAEGYRLIAVGYQASHGASALGYEMRKLKAVMEKLSETERTRWFKELDDVWRNLPTKNEKKQIAPLISEITRLYSEFLPGKSSPEKTS